MAVPLHLLDAPPDTFLADNLKNVRERLAQVPLDKKGALVVAVDLKWGVLPTAKIGYAHRITDGWSITGDGFLSKADKGASITSVWTW